MKSTAGWSGRAAYLNAAQVSAEINLASPEFN